MSTLSTGTITTKDAKQHFPVDTSTETGLSTTINEAIFTTKISCFSCRQDFLCVVNTYLDSCVLV